MKPKHWFAEISPTRTSLTSYIFPLGGVILGVVFLHEEFTWQLFLGTLLIIASIGVVNWKSRKRIFNKNYETTRTG
jgi:drug/metabolite transporter (DMT)-like permease